MTTQDRPNKQALSAALDIYRDAMRRFITIRLRRVGGAQIEDLIAVSLHYRRAEDFRARLRQGSAVQDAIDVNDFPNLVSRNWDQVFRQEFGGERVVQNLLWMISDARNKVAHPAQQDIDLEYSRSRLYDIADVLGRINRSDESQAVEGIRTNLVGQPSQATAPADPQSSQHPEPSRTSRSSQNLKPWREVIGPTPDVALGSFQEAEFAADLQQVHDGRANATNYGNPVSFFNQTYITPGISTLMVNTLRRIAGAGGDPVIQTKTGFGGGKTHSLIALYHLVSDTDALVNPTAQDEQSISTSESIRDIMREAGFDPDSGPRAKIAVLDGTFLAPTDQRLTDGGDPRNTLWGEMAYQLGGQDAYDIVGDAARQGTSPGGDQLDRLLEHVGPCVILMDELVAYVRNAGPASDSIYTFIQAFTQSVRRSDSCALVVTLPQSAVEAGAEGGAEALNRLDSILGRIEAGDEAGADVLNRLDSILGRIEAVWQPLEVDQAFEVVRRRLFGSVIDEAERDRTCEAFSRMYGRGSREYPTEAAEQRYLERMRECYPIHPEVFDRLYQDWSAISRFQRTRGVLRMMANWISRLYLDNDNSPLILPADLRLSDPSLANEFTTLLDSQWDPVVSEADSDGSRTDVIDHASQNFAQVGGAARRVARAIFLGSSTAGATRGIDIRRIHLGAVQPGHGTAVYDDALRRMVGDLYFLYSADDRYYFHAEENLNKVAADRAGAVTGSEIEEHVVGRLRDAAGRRSDVVVCPGGSADVYDGHSVRLVILPPSSALPTRAAEDNTAEQAARGILLNRGDAPRARKNTVVFLAAKTDDLRALRRSVRSYLAWDSIVNGDRRIENLVGARMSQARGSLGRYEAETVNGVVRSYRWTLAPVQDDPQTPEYRFSTMETDAPATGEIVAGAFDKLLAEEALADVISPSALATMLDQYVWSNPRYEEHIGIDALWEIMASNVYMHRLRDKSVLIDCIRAGTELRAFGYAPAASEGRYASLRYGEPVEPGSIHELRGLLVSPTMAQLQKDAEAAGREDAPSPDDEHPSDVPYDPTPSGEDHPTAPPTLRGPSRIVTGKVIQGRFDLNDVGLIENEIIQNLRADGGDVTITITISATKPDGFSESITRSVRENSAQLGLEFSTDSEA